MALTESYMLPLGTQAPKFKLLDVIENKDKSLQELTGEKGTLIVFMCNHCPYVVHLMDAIVETASIFSKQGVETIAISSNSIHSHPQDGPIEMNKLAKEKNFSFPYLYDESQKVARNYDAACTPDFFVFDKNKELVYRGQLDDSRPGNDIPLNGKDIREVFESIINSRSITINQKPSIGCNIKWKN